MAKYDDQLAFDPELCSTDPVTRISPCVNMLVDPSVPESPPEIPDCEEDFIPPLPPDPPCPDIAVGSAGSDGVGMLNYGGTYASNPPGARLLIVKGDCCDFNFLLDVSVPCPTLGPEGSAGGSGTVNLVNGPGAVRYGFTSNYGTCDFDLTIDIDVPCPQFATESTVVPFADGHGTLTYGITPGANCSFDLNIDIELDFPDVSCPPIGPTAPTAIPIPTCDGTEAYLVYNFVASANCNYALEIGFSGDVFGCPGVSGSRGYQGFQGPPGVDGSAGSIGFQGDSGDEGPQGFQGFQGFQGPAGGAQGFQGFQGYQGFQGPADGAQGAQGAQGYQGFQGPADGAQGYQGSTGSTGNQGAQGYQGPRAATSANACGSFSSTPSLRSVLVAGLLSCCCSNV